LNWRFAKPVQSSQAGHAREMLDGKCNQNLSLGNIFVHAERRVIVCLELNEADFRDVEIHQL
jgi:hypothetical protein